MARYLAIDPGTKRTGLAVGDDETRHAGPAGVIETGDPGKLLREIRDAIEEHAPDALVIGVPYNMDGSEGPPAKRAFALATLLAEHTGLEVHRVDERLTSFAAEDLLTGRELTHKQKKARRDAMAATVILRDFLARRHN